MKSFAVGLAAFVALRGAAALKFTAEAVDASPVEQVVQMLTEMKTNVEADGKTEQQAYDKYACWCEDTLAKKAQAISTAKESIEDLSTKIVKLKGELGVHGAEIQQLKKDIAANMESQKEATQIREKGAANYEAEKSESEQCIGALEAAVGVLSGAPKKGFLETLHEAQLLSVVAGVRGVLRRPSVEKSMASNDLEVVREFVEHPDDFVGKGGASVSAAQMSKGRNPYGDYAPQSTQIQGILKGMYDTFSKDLEKANGEEAEKQKGFEELMSTKAQELTTLKETLGTQTTGKATKTKTLSDSKVERDDTKEQLEADEKFFAEVKGSCSTKAGEWAERTRLRTQELTGIAEAIKVLSSDEAKATFQNSSKSAASFLQFSQAGSAGKGRSAAYGQLRQLAGKYQDIQLAQLAMRVQAGGHFDEVMSTIDNMIGVLREEGNQDIKERDWCQSREGKNRNDLEDLNSAITKANATVERLKDEVNVLDGKIATVNEAINASQTGLEDMKNMRVDEQAAFAQGVKDDTKAIELLEQAIRHLAVYHKAASLLAATPEEGESSGPPPATWSGDYNKRQGEGHGIVSILTLIKEDVGRQITTARRDDAKAQENYESDRKAAQATLNAQTKSKVELDSAKADLGLKISDTEEFRSEKGDDLSAENDKKKSLSANCDWVETHFKTRREKRQTEIEGLVDAKNYLAGVDSD